MKLESVKESSNQGKERLFEWLNEVLPSNRRRKCGWVVGVNNTKT